jgi:hypothetical protein
MSLDFDPDDMPDGYPNAWGAGAEQLRAYGVLMIRTSVRALGVARKDDLTDDGTVEARRKTARAHSKTHYERVKRDAEWVAERREYYRRRYARGPARIKDGVSKQLRYARRHASDPVWRAAKKAAQRKYQQRPDVKRRRAAALKAKRGGDHG